MGSLIFEDLASIVLDRLDLKFTKGDYTEAVGSDETRYDFHVLFKSEINGSQNYQLEKYVIHMLTQRGFTHPKVSIKSDSSRKPIHPHTIFKRVWHKHGEVTCPTYYLTLIFPVLDVISLALSATGAGFQKILKPKYFTHRVGIVLTDQAKFDVGLTR